jgi:hypothetical protein
MVNGKMPIAMNKHISLLLTVIWFVACHPNHDLGTPFQKGQEVTLTANIGEQQPQMLPGMQRVSGKDATDKIDLTWDEGDNILVTVGDKSSVFTLSTGAGTPQGTFTGTIPADGASYSVQYPTTTPNLTEQHYVPNGFGKDLMRMTTKMNGTLDGGFTLSADYALLGLQLTGNTEIGKIVLSKNNAAGTAGDLSYTLLCPTVTLTAAPTLFYIVVSPDTWANGFTVDVYNKTYSTLIKQFVTTKSTTFSTTNATIMPEKHVEKTYEYVDLGLPSGILWAKCNIGADTETEAGLYFQWGDTQGYTADQVGVDKIFDWAHYKFGTRDNLTKYNSTDGLTTLQPEDDAAYANMGKDWKVPTEVQYQELIDNTPSEWVDNYNNTGVSGRLYTGTNGNTLFLPAVGIAFDNMIFMSYSGSYWAASLNQEYAFESYYLYIIGGEDEDLGKHSINRFIGFPIRGVKEANK